MEHCIYHSRDLDGLTSGAIIYNSQTSFGEDCFLTGYDYGQKLDTRIFKGKSTIMIDVSMPMDRMELLGKNCMEFIWIDHHVSAFNSLLEYCDSKGYEIKRNKYNDQIERVEVNAMNMIYFYSEKLSGCEITAILHGKQLSRSARKLISILGQYDTWRDSDQKKFTLDEDWNEVVLPVQYFMRTCASPVEVNNIFRKMNDWNSKLEIKDIVQNGINILKYQQTINNSVIKNNFDFELFGLKIIALNTTNFNSMSFDGYYHEEIHDAMMPFCYNGKTKKWNFSLYTTKSDVNILEIAKNFGGGGHAKACGFTVNPEFLKFGENSIEFGDFKKIEYKFSNPEEVMPSLFEKEKPSKKGHVHKEVDGVDYLITNLLVKEFDRMLVEDREAFDNHFSKFIVEPKTN